jgi:DNA (cytosine-5)-methyltransferase 3A
VVNLEVEGQVDLLIGGSPCQDLSIAKKDRKGLDGDRSGLFWEFLRIKKECNPQWFVLENVASMPKADRDIITREMGVEPVMFNASLVSAQSRKRLFWTNIPFDLPEDRGILLKDILQPDGEVDERMVVDGKAYCLSATYSHVTTTEAGVKHSIDRKKRTMVRVGRDVGRRLVDGHRADADTSIPYERRIETREDDKCGTLTSVAKDNLVVGERIRKLTPIECERLQGLPDNYTEGVAMTHRYKCLGNAFNVDVVAHILGRVKLMYSP